MPEDFFDKAEEPDRRCENCMYYEERESCMVCGVREAEYTEEQLKAMSAEEYEEKFCKRPDGYCHDHEFWED